MEQLLRQLQPEQTINGREPNGRKVNEINKEMKSDWGNDSVSVQDCSDHTASALCPGLIFGFPGPAQHLMRFHTSASGVSFLLYTLCYESIQKP